MDSEGERVRKIKKQNKQQEKFIILYDTAKKCLLILDHLYVDLENCLSSDEVEEDSSIVIKVYVAALGLIDYFHRFHEIVSAMPLINKDQQELKRLKKTLSPVKGCRNYLQHMRGDLMKNDPIDYPTLGAISWIHEGRNYLLLSNQVLPFSAPGIPYDTVENKFTCKYMLAVGGHEVRLDTVYSEVKSFWGWLEQVARIEPSQIKEYTWGKPTITHVEFKLEE